MHRYVRFALSCVPDPTTDLAVLGRHWFGWDPESGTQTRTLKIDKLSRTPLQLAGRRRRYGFQAPILAPFRLGRGHSALDLHHTARALAEHFTPITLSGLRMARRPEGLCVVPLRRSDALDRLAVMAARVFDEFHASPGLPLTGGTVALHTHGSPSEPTPDPFELRFQVTDRVPADETSRVFAVMRPILEPNLPRPFIIRSLCLMGEDREGWFHRVQRYPLGGQGARRETRIDGAPAPREVPLSW